jgi:hypothetical protein
VGAAMINVGSGRNEVGIDTSGAKTIGITTLIGGGSIATGRATMTGGAGDTRTMTITAVGTTTGGTVVSGCHQSITRLGTSLGTTLPTNCQSRRMVAGGSELTTTWY